MASISGYKPAQSSKHLRICHQMEISIITARSNGPDLKAGNNSGAVYYKNAETFVLSIYDGRNRSIWERKKAVKSH